MQRELKLFLTFAALSLATRAVVLGAGIVDLDEAAYATVAREILRGDALYAEVADHKPPLVFAWYALAQWLLGPTMLGVRLLTDLLLIPATALGISAFFDHDRRGLVAAIAWIAYGAAFFGHDMLAVNCESLMMLPLVWSLVAVRRPEHARRGSRLALAGFLVGLATLLKYHAALWLPIALVGAWRSKGPLSRTGFIRAALFLGAGFAAPLLATYAAFAVRGLGGDFIYWNLTHNISYVASTIAPQAALARAAATVLPFLVVTAPLWIAAWRSRLLDDDDAHRRVLAVASLVLAAVGVIPGQRFYPHYLVPLYAPLAWLAAPWLATQLRPPLTRAGRWVVAWTAIAVVGFAGATAWLLRQPDVYSERRSVFAKTAEEMRRRACRPDGPIFVWGFAPQFYYEADRPAASRFIMVSGTLVGHMSDGQTNPSAIRKEHWDWLMSDLERTPPDFIVDASAAGLSRWTTPMSAFPRFSSFVARRYRPVARVEGAVLWQRKGCRVARKP